MPFDLDAQAAVDRMLASIRAHIEEDVRARADELIAVAQAERNRAAEEAAEAARQEASRQAQAEIAEGEAARQKAEAEAAAEVAEARRAARALVEGMQRESDQRLTDLSRERDDTRRELEESRRRAADAGHELDVVRRDREDLRRERDEARHARDAAARDLDDARRELRSARLEIEEVRSAAVAGAGTRVSEAVTASLQTGQRRFDEPTDRQAREWREVELSRTQSVVGALRSLDEATSLGDVLDRLARSAAQTVDRVAVLIVQRDRLQAWRMFGFDAAGSARGAEFGLDAAGPLASAVRDGRVVHGDIAGQAPPAFAVSPAARHFAALPLTLGGVVVAAVYGDVLPASQALDDRWPSMLEVLTRHASRVLETMTLQQAGLGPGRLARHRPLSAQGHPS